MKQIYYGVGLFILNVVLISLLINTTFKGLHFDNGNLVLSNWNYIQTSFQISIFSLMFGIFQGQSKEIAFLKNENTDNSGCLVWFYTSGFPVLFIFLFYPSEVFEGVRTNILTIVVISATIIQSFFTYIISLLFENEYFDKVILIILLILSSIALVYITPFLIIP